MVRALPASTLCSRASASVWRSRKLSAEIPSARHAREKASYRMRFGKSREHATSFSQSTGSLGCRIDHTDRRTQRSPVNAAFTRTCGLCTSPWTRMQLMKARWGDRVIAESDETLEVGGYVYFPRDSV